MAKPRCHICEARFLLFGNAFRPQVPLVADINAVHGSSTAELEPCIDVITVHYLKIGRPLFTVWLLEELALDYELNIFVRDAKTMRAPPDLRQIHPLGKSPVIDDGELRIAESGAITDYLISAYDKPGNLSPERSQTTARARYSQWLHYAEGSAFLPLLLSMLVMRAGEPAPALIENFAKAETSLHLNYLSDSLGGNAFILGDNLSGADFGIGYIVAMAARLRLLTDYPTLLSYLSRIKDRPAFGRAVARTGEEIAF